MLASLLNEKPDLSERKAASTISENGRYRIPKDNPFVNRRGALPGIWSYGHRNPQGLAWNPFTNELWEDEHGPMGGDEVNIIRKGKNYDEYIGEKALEKEGEENSGKLTSQ